MYFECKKYFERTCFEQTFYFELKQIDNAQGEAAGGATIEHQARAKSEPTIISVRDSELQALSQSFHGAEHLAKLKSVGESQGQALPQSFPCAEPPSLIPNKKTLCRPAPTQSPIMY
jgi:hypothetical protein